MLDWGLYGIVGSIEIDKISQADLNSLELSHTNFPQYSEPKKCWKALTTSEADLATAG